MTDFNTWPHSVKKTNCNFSLSFILFKNKLLLFYLFATLTIHLTLRSNPLNFTLGERGRHETLWTMAYTGDRGRGEGSQAVPADHYLV